MLTTDSIFIGNQMVSSAIWNKWAQVNFSDCKKLHATVGLLQFVVFEKFSSAYLYKIALEIIWLVV